MSGKQRQDGEDGYGLGAEGASMRESVRRDGNQEMASRHFEGWALQVYRMGKIATRFQADCPIPGDDEGEACTAKASNFDCLFEVNGQ